MIKLIAILMAAATMMLTSCMTPSSRAKNEYEAAAKRAKADYYVARDSCNRLAGDAKDLCMTEAKAARTQAITDAKVRYLGSAEAVGDAREEQVEADYKVAREKCNALAGSEKDLCILEAKVARDRAEAQIEAAEDKMKADYRAAEERCLQLAGTYRSACLAEARATYGQ